MDTLLELAERCEQATGPDRELDCAIAVVALGFFVAEPRYKGDVRYCYKDSEGVTHLPGNAGDMLVRAYTTSLDAAMSLVPEGCIWWMPFPNDARIGDSEGHTLNPLPQQCATPALALCAAALRARAANPRRKEG